MMTLSAGRSALPWRGIACALLLASLPLWCRDLYILSVATSIGIFVIAAISLNLLLGYTGQLSLGHAAFFGIGAYTSALLSLGFDVDLKFAKLVVAPKPVWIAFLGAVIISGISGWLIGKLAFRVRGAYFVVVTISFAQVSRLVALNWVDLTEGPMALNSIPPLSLWLPGVGVMPLVTKAAKYWVVLVFGLISYLAVARLVRSRIGRALIALRENESLARSVGISVTHYLVIASIASAAIAGTAGALYAHNVQIVDPDVFLFVYTVTMVIMVIVGGKGTLAGPVVGGILFGAFPEVLRDYARPEAQWIIYGVAMIVILVFLPEGIVPALSRLRFWRVRAARAPAAVPVTEPALSAGKNA
jgi:branched-chain amino acid transport system permease protein